MNKCFVNFWGMKTRYLIYFRHFLIFHNAFFFYFYGMHYSCSILGWLLVKKRVIHAFNAYCFTELVQISQTDVSPFKRQFLSLPDHVASYKNQNEKILEPNKRSLLLLWLVVRSELRLEFLKKSAEPLTKLRLDKLKTRKI